MQPKYNKQYKQSKNTEYELATRTKLSYKNIFWSYHELDD